jgi:hypothetical protein
MKVTHFLFATTAISIGLHGCEKIPREVKTQIAIKGAQETDQESTEPSKSIAEKASDPSIYDRSSIRSMVDAVSRNSQPVSTDLRMCHALLKTMVDESYFYQFQSNIKNYRLREEHAELVRGHVKYHRIDTAKSIENAPYEECADIIASFERFQDVRAIARLSRARANNTLNKQLIAFRSGKNLYAIDRCADVIASLKDESEFSALIQEFSRADGRSLSPEVVMASMLEHGHVDSQEETAMITPKGCIKALTSFASFDEIKQFAAADSAQRRQKLGVHSRGIVAH